MIMCYWIEHVWFKWFVKNIAANAASEYILANCANPVLMVFAQNHQLIENSQTSMSNTGCPAIVQI